MSIAKIVCPECGSANVDWDDEPFICDDCNYEWWLNDPDEYEPESCPDCGRMEDWCVCGDEFHAL